MMQVLFSNHYEYHSARFHGGVISRGGHATRIPLSSLLGNPSALRPGAGFNCNVFIQNSTRFSAGDEEEFAQQAEPTKQSPSEPFTVMSAPVLSPRRPREKLPASTSGIQLESLHTTSLLGPLFSLKRGERKEKKKKKSKDVEIFAAYSALDVSM